MKVKMTVSVVTAMWIISTTVLAAILLSCSAWDWLDLLKPYEDPLDVKNVQVVNCGNQSDPIQLKDVKVSHDNRRFVVYLRIEAKAEITKPIKVTYGVQHEGILFPIPIQGVIQDMCAFDALVTHNCTAKVNKRTVQCKCPLQKNTELEFFLKFHLPYINSLSGDYRSELRLKQRSRDLACYIVKFSLT